MNLAWTATLLGLAAAAAVAAALGGALGVGALAGFAAASFVGLAAGLHRAHLARTRPERAFGAFAVAFLAKLGLLLAGTLLLRFVEPLGARADWRAFALGFAAGALWLSLFTTIQTSRTLSRQGAR
jgi:hypothetical protein